MQIDAELNNELAARFNLDTPQAMICCLRVMVVALLACTALLAPGRVSAQPHTEPKLEEIVTPTAEPDVWLRRLVGRYQFEGIINVVAKGDCGYCEGIKGTADCVSVGTGPGVQCILNVAWEDIHEVVTPSDTERGGVYNIPGGVSYLDPAMALYGLDPGKSGINYLLVDNKGLPEGGLGFIAGNTATFRTPCVNTPVLLNSMRPPPRGEAQWRTCDRTIRIDARPDAKLLFMTIDIEINDDPFIRFTLSLHRMQPAGEGAAPAKPSASR